MPDPQDGGPLGVWFEVEDDEDRFGPGELEFLRELRSCATAAGWTADPDDSAVVPALGDTRRELLVVLHVVDHVMTEHLFTCGVFFDGPRSRIAGDRIHGQMLTLESCGRTALLAGGTPRELARRASDWFGRVLAAKSIVYDN